VTFSLTYHRSFLLVRLRALGSVVINDDEIRLNGLSSLLITKNNCQIQDLPQPEKKQQKDIKRSG